MKKNRKVLCKMYDLWCVWYSKIIPIFFAVTVIFLQYRFDLKIWLIEDYSDMLTAIITFLSIIIGIFGILIPAVLSAKGEKNSMASYFFDRADNISFAKSIKSIFSSGIITILMICILYLKDIAGRKCYIYFLGITVFFLIYFCCNAYRFIGIMIDLLIRRKKNSSDIDSHRKEYKNKMSEKEKENVDKMIYDRNKR